MTEEDIKHLLYGSIKELMKDRKYFYDGIITKNFTDEGKKVINEVLDMYSIKISKAQSEADDKRAKNLVIKELKG
jgi:citrate lyase gamma subunit